MYIVVIVLYEILVDSRPYCTLVAGFRRRFFKLIHGWNNNV